MVGEEKLPPLHEADAPAGGERGQPPESIWTTAITVFEIRFGLEILAKGRKRKALEDAFGSE